MSIYDDAQRMRDELERMYATRVRVALFGQPGAGKSSLINALCGAEVAPVGVRTDTTVASHAYEHNGLVFVDLPGYDTKRFPKETFWQKFEVDTFDLFLCVFDGKLHAADTALFGELRRAGKVSLFVRNKHDQLWQRGRTTEELEREIVVDVHRQLSLASVEVFFTSCRDTQGIDRLESAIGKNLEPAKAERWVRSAAAYTAETLKQKRAACEKIVAIAAAASAAGALIPIPGSGIALNIASLVGLFVGLRSNYGLTTERLLAAEAIPTVAATAQELLSLATQQGVLLLLEQFAARGIAAEFAKWVPLIGSAIAASIGFGITMKAGSYYNDLCYEVAEAILEHELQRRAA